MFAVVLIDETGAESYVHILLTANFQQIHVSFMPFWKTISFMPAQGSRNYFEAILQAS